MSETSSRPPTGRAGQTLRDMLLSLAVLLVIIGALLFTTRGCSFSPGGPSIDQNAAPSVDAAAELRSAATRVDFPVRNVAMPAGWRANTATVAPVGTGANATVAVRVGLITPEGRYLQLSQSNGQVPTLVVSEPSLDAAQPPAATGKVQAAGAEWTVYPGRSTESTWVTSRNGVNLVITGSGTPEEFRTLAGAALAAAPLPTSSR